MVKLLRICNLLLLLVCSEMFCCAQKLLFDGYLSTLYMPICNFETGNFDHNGLLHNRLNIESRLAEKWSFTAQIRNRVMLGTMAHGETIDNGFMNLSIDWANRRNFKFNSQMDRLNVAYYGEKFSAVIGRQRINWSQTLVFNPNDIFNGYSLFDYDYAERAGSDALRLSYYPSEVSVVELPIKLNRWGKVTAALLHRFNMKGYDFQYLAGIVESRDIAIGAGFSGEIKGVNVRGEVSNFYNTQIDQNTVVATLGADYVFPNAISLVGEVLYNTQYAHSRNDISLLYQTPLTPSRLSITSWTLVAQATYPVSPIINCGFMTMCFVDLPIFYFGPSIDCSIFETLTLSANVQTFVGGKTISPSSMGIGYIRLKYNF